MICKTKINEQFSTFSNPARLFVLTRRKNLHTFSFTEGGGLPLVVHIDTRLLTARDGASPGNMVVQGKRTLLQKIVRCSRRVYRGSTGGLGCVTQPGKALPPVRFPSSWAGGIPQARPLHVASTFVSQAAAPAAGDYGRVFKKSVEEPDQLWAEAAQSITWHKPWTKTMERKDPFSTSW